MAEGKFTKGTTVMQLTEEQHLLVEAAQGHPVDVRDPHTNRAYVLLTAELYQRVRDLVEAGGPPPQATGSPPASETIPLRVVLRKLPTPPEVAQAVQRRCRQLGFWRRKYVQEVEDELKFQYYYGGQYVAYLQTEEGPVVVAAGRLESETFGHQLDALSPENRRAIHYAVPTIWNDPISELRTPFSDESPTPSG
jgi:hypothetical protein